MSAISPIVTCSTLYEYQTPDGRIVPLWHTRLATPEERERVIESERTPEFYAELRREQELREARAREPWQCVEEYLCGDNG